jgi:hypothetical protein
MASLEVPSPPQNRDALSTPFHKGKSLYTGEMAAGNMRRLVPLHSQERCFTCAHIRHGNVSRSPLHHRCAESRLQTSGMAPRLPLRRASQRNVGRARVLLPGRSGGPVFMRRPGRPAFSQPTAGHLAAARRDRSHPSGDSEETFAFTASRRLSDACRAQAPSSPCSPCCLSGS